MLAPLDSCTTKSADVIRNADTDAGLDWTETYYVIMIERGLSKGVAG